MRILESALYAEDLSAARDFYSGTLCLPEIWFDPERSLFLRCESSVLLIFKASKTRIPDAGVPTHGAEGAGHLAFACRHDEIQTWHDRLEAAGVPIISEIKWDKGGHSIYFHDPAGNVLEFATTDLWGITGPGE